MPTSVFKGVIKPGEVTAKFLSDFSNVDPDLLSIAFAPTSGTGGVVDRGVAAPGGFASVGVTATTDGIVEVLVDMGHDTESGRLTVSHNGAVLHDEPIVGSVRWVYAVAS